MIQLIQTKAMVLTPENIEPVVNDPETYRGYTFILSGESIHRRRGYTKFYYLVQKLLSVWKICDWEFKIIAPKGLNSIDRALGVYVNEVV